MENLRPIQPLGIFSSSFLKTESLRADKMYFPFLFIETGFLPGLDLGEDLVSLTSWDTSTPEYIPRTGEVYALKLKPAKIALGPNKSDS